MDVHPLFFQGEKMESVTFFSEYRWTHNGCIAFRRPAINPLFSCIGCVPHIPVRDYRILIMSIQTAS